MQFPAPVSLEWLAQFTGAELIGDPQAMATGINEIHRVEKGDLVFVDHPRYYEKCLRSAADFIIINQRVACPPGKALLIAADPFEAYCRIVEHFNPFIPATQMISGTAVIGADTHIFPGAFIGNRVRIGSHCIIHPGVVILDNCIIGDHVIIQSGTVIGSDAFYYNGKKDREYWYKKMPSSGRVIIKDYAEIGANCCIDRGVSHDTTIGEGTKLDNMIHVGHDTVIGRNCLFAAQVVIGGCTNIGNGVILWGQVAVNKTLTIGDHAIVLATSGVGSSLEGGKTYFGTPAQEAGLARRELVWMKRIPEIWNKVFEKK